MPHKPLLLLVVSAALVGAGCSDRGLGVVGPDSGGLVLIQHRAGAADVARARLSDGRVVRVTRSADREERWPYWSPIAQRVAYEVRPYRADLRTRLVLWDPATGEEVFVGGDPARDEHWAAWSPTENELAFAFRTLPGPSGIALHDVARNRTSVIARSGRSDTFRRPVYAADGRRILLERRIPGDRRARLWLFEKEAGLRELLADARADDTKGQFSRDGGTLWFTRWGAGGGGRLLTLDLATGELRSVFDDEKTDDHSSKPSPVRNEVAFVSKRDGSYDVFLLDLETRALRNLTQSPGLDEVAPVWSPDGELLVTTRIPSVAGGVRAAQRASRQDPEHTRIAVIDREGRILLETQGMMADWMPAWPGR